MKNTKENSQTNAEENTLKKRQGKKAAATEEDQILRPDNSHAGQLLEHILKVEMGAEESEIRELLSKTDDRVYLKNLFGAKEFNFNQVMVASLLTGLSPEEFGHPSIPLLRAYQPIFISEEMYPQVAGGFAKYIRTYYSIIKKEVKKAKESIIVIDFLGDKQGADNRMGGYGDYKSIYHDENDEYLKCINERVLGSDNREPLKEYIRVFQLPYLSREFRNKGERLKELVKLLYPEMVKHIMVLHSLGNTRFSLIEKPVRLFSYMTIDSFETVVSEYHSIVEGRALPDMLFVNRTISSDENFISNTDVSYQIIKSHAEDYEKYIEPHEEFFTTKELLNGVVELLEDVSKEVLNFNTIQNMNPDATDKYTLLKGKDILNRLKDAKDKLWIVGGDESKNFSYENMGLEEIITLMEKSIEN